LGPTTINLGTIPFVVSGVASSIPVPTLTLLWKFVLLMLVLGIARTALAIRHRRST
jgi:hypothetical protein